MEYLVGSDVLVGVTQARSGSQLPGTSGGSAGAGLGKRPGAGAGVAAGGKAFAALVIDAKTKIASAQTNVRTAANNLAAKATAAAPKVDALTPIKGNAPKVQKPTQSVAKAVAKSLTRVNVLKTAKLKPYIKAAAGAGAGAGTFPGAGGTGFGPIKKKDKKDKKGRPGQMIGELDLGDLILNEVGEYDAVFALGDDPPPADTPADDPLAGVNDLATANDILTKAQADLVDAKAAYDAAVIAARAFKSDPGYVMAYWAPELDVTAGQNYLLAPADSKAVAQQGQFVNPSANVPSFKVVAYQTANGWTARGTGHAVGRLYAGGNQPPGYTKLTSIDDINKHSDGSFTLNSSQTYYITQDVLNRKGAAVIWRYLSKGEYKNNWLDATAVDAAVMATKDVCDKFEDLINRIKDLVAAITNQPPPTPPDPTKTPPPDLNPPPPPPPSDKQPPGPGDQQGPPGPGDQQGPPGPGDQQVWPDGQFPQPPSGYGGAGGYGGEGGGAFSTDEEGYPTEGVPSDEGLFDSGEGGEGGEGFGEGGEGFGDSGEGFGDSGEGSSDEAVGAMLAEVLGAYTDYDNVLAAQKALDAKGFKLKKGIDGKYGPDTAQAVEAFWNAQGVSHDKLVDDDLMQALGVTPVAPKPRKAGGGGLLSLTSSDAGATASAPSEGIAPWKIGVGVGLGALALTGIVTAGVAAFGRKTLG